MSNRSDHSLLVALMALQMELISRDQLLAAMGDWIEDKQQPISQVLIRQGALNVVAAESLEQLADQRIERHEGNVQESLASFATLESTLKDQLLRIDDREVTRSILALTQLSGDGSRGAGEFTSQGRFSIVRLHAEGGLGEVYLADDRELHRPVALKQIKQTYADRPESKSRFLVEAELTAKLEHPSIVPVYGLGHDEFGRPYYAMKFIRGESLRNRIDEFHQKVKQHEYTSKQQSLAMRELLGHFVDVCQAVEYAHSRGVLHRDLKPANVMLGRYGETLVVDWGLAKTVNMSDEHGQFAATDEIVNTVTESGSETVFGQPFGTLSYASPEQVSGSLNEMGPASDVYSLGATLYVILTGRPPFQGKPAEVIKQVKAGAFDRPRKLQPKLPVALEAICLKAMSHRAGNRYPSPGQLAADIEAWLADEPIVAGPEPVTVRARRWVRKHPRSVASMAASLLVGLLAAVTISVVVGQANRLLTEANRSERDARGEAEKKSAALAIALSEISNKEAQVRAERDRASTNLAAARQAIDEYLVLVSDHPKLKEDEFFDLRTSLLESAIPFLESLIENEPSKANINASRGDALFRLGTLTKDLGDEEKSIDCFRQSISIYEALCAANPDDTEYPFELARCHNNLGLLYMDTQELSEAEKQLQVSLEIKQMLMDQGITDPDVISGLSTSHHNLADVYTTWGQVGEARRHLEQAIELQQDLCERYPDNPTYLNHLAISLDAYTLNLQNQNEFDRALKTIEEAESINRKLLDLDPRNPYFTSALSISLRTQASTLGDLNRLAEGDECYQESIKLIKDLCQRFPSFRSFQKDHATARINYGAFLFNRLDDAQRAKEQFQEGLTVLEYLGELDPTNYELRHETAITYFNLGNTHDELGNTAELLANYQRAKQLLEQLVDEYPSIPAYAHHLAGVGSRLASAMLAAGANPVEVIEQQLQAIDQMQSVCEQVSIPQYWFELGRFQMECAELSLEYEIAEIAERNYRQAAATFARLAESFPDDPIFRMNIASCRFNQAMAMIYIEPQAALGVLQRVPPILSTVTGDSEFGKEARGVKRNVLVGRAMAFEFLGKYEKASLSWGRAAGMAVGMDKKALLQSAAESRRRAESTMRFDTLMNEDPAKWLSLSSEELVDLASHCESFGRRHYDLAVKAYELAAQKSPEVFDPQVSESGYFAAQSAILAAAELSDADRSRQIELRKKALAWLEIELSYYETGLTTDIGIDPRVVALRWLHHSQLASVRDSEYLSELSPAERLPWKSFWKSVSALASAPNQAQQRLAQ